MTPCLAAEDCFLWSSRRSAVCHYSQPYCTPLLKTHIKFRTIAYRSDSDSHSSPSSSVPCNCLNFGIRLCTLNTHNTEANNFLIAFIANCYLPLPDTELSSLGDRYHSNSTLDEVTPIGFSVTALGRSVSERERGEENQETVRRKSDQMQELL